MKQKNYTFAAQGKSITKTLGLPTNERIVRFLRLLGKSSFTELLTPEGQKEYGLWVLNLAVDMERLRETLDVCLEEGSEGIDFDLLDMRTSDEVVQDFFEQRSKMFLERMRS